MAKIWPERKNMSFELSILAASLILGLVHLFAASAAVTSVRGTQYNLGNREGEPEPLKGVPARLDLAFGNFKETFPFFLATIALVAFTGRYSWLSHWGALLYFAARLIYLPVYAAGIVGLRTVIWLVSMVGILMVLASVLLASA
jgi:uncharacterized MAPEG superfamily protein